MAKKDDNTSNEVLAIAWSRRPRTGRPKQTTLETDEQFALRFSEWHKADLEYMRAYKEYRRRLAGMEPKRVFETEEDRILAQKEYKRKHYNANVEEYNANSMAQYDAIKENPDEYRKRLARSAELKRQARREKGIGPKKKYETEEERKAAIKSASKKHRDAHSDEYYDERHTEQYRASRRPYAREYARRRRQEDIQYKLKSILGCRVRSALRTGPSAGAKRAARTMELIGCPINHVRLHIESLFLIGMTWENYGEWHIDHIKPCASFDLTDHEQQRRCFHWENLQPLWALDNIRKSDRLDWSPVADAITTIQRDLEVKATLDTPIVSSRKLPKVTSTAIRRRKNAA